MYDSLRGTYNSFRPAGSLPVPPLEEWHGVDVFCDDCYCRCVDFTAGADRRYMVNATAGKRDVVRLPSVVSVRNVFLPRWLYDEFLKVCL